MSDEKCTPRQTAVCEEKVLKEATDKAQCEDIDVCLPFGGRLYTNGGCLAYEPGTAPEDGTYGKVKVQNGCIVGVEEDDASLYTASPCAPVPTPCDCDGSSSGISSVAGNLLYKDGSGNLAAVLHYEAGEGISMSGDGTVESPLTVAFNGATGGNVSGVIGRGAIQVTESNGVAIVEHKATSAGGGSIGQVQVDAYGHVIGFSESQNQGINGVLGGDGIEVTMDNNTKIATVSLEDMLGAPSGVVMLGGYDATVDTKGRITDLDQKINLSSGTYALGDYNVTVNRLGSITKIESAGGGGGDDAPSSGLVSGGVLFEYTWLTEYYISVDFTLAKKSHVRVLFSPNSGNAPGGLIADIDGSVDLNRSMSYFTGVAIFSRTQIAAGSHTMHLRPYSVSGGSDSYGGTFEIQAFTLGTIDDGSNS